MKVYMYTNKNGFDETYRIPLVPCEMEFLDQKIVDMDYYGKYYCPDFKDDDLLINNYYYSEYAWMRWTIERC